MTEKLYQTLNRANPNNYPAVGHKIHMGDIIMGLPRNLRNETVTDDVIVLEDNLKAQKILHAFAINTSATAAELTVVKSTDVLASGQCKITDEGNIAFFAGEISKVSATYLPATHLKTLEKEQVVISSDQYALPSEEGAGVFLYEVIGYHADGTYLKMSIDTVTIPLVAPVAGHVSYDEAHGKILFANADLIVKADVSYAIDNPDEGTLHDLLLEDGMI